MPQTFTLISKISTPILQQTGKMLQMSPVDADLRLNPVNPALHPGNIQEPPLIALAGGTEMTDIVERDNCYRS